MTENRNIVAKIIKQEGIGSVKTFHMANEIRSKSTVTIDPKDYRILPNTFQNGHQVYAHRFIHTS